MKGYTLIEVLVAIGVLSIMGVLVLNIFTSTLRGSNKTQILSAIKQNGQAVLDSMDKTIRNADHVACVSQSGDTLVVVKEGKYTRYKFISPRGLTNGQIKMDMPVQPQPPAPKSDIKLFLNNACTDPIGADSPTPPQVLTDTNPQTGVSAKSGRFTLNKQAGSKDAVTITLVIGAGEMAPPILRGQIDPVEFKTTVQLR